MACEPNPIALKILRYPFLLAFGILVFGLLGGYLAETSFGNSLFERFGALTAGIGVLLFGVAAGELLTRGQHSFYMDDDGEPVEPFKSRTVRLALNCQALVVFIGTIQWGFGGLLIAR
jgi:hypothetical protein